MARFHDSRKMIDRNERGMGAAMVGAAALMPAMQEATRITAVATGAVVGNSFASLYRDGVNAYLFGTFVWLCALGWSVYNAVFGSAVVSPAMFFVMAVIFQCMVVNGCRVSKLQRYDPLLGRASVHTSLALIATIGSGYAAYEISERMGLSPQGFLFMAGSI